MVFTFACATAMAALVVANYLVWRPVRLFLSVLFALPVVGLVGFVTSVPLAQESAASINVSVSSETPVVVLVMDEFPVSSLMTANGTIDAARYPNFARLGRSAIWYPRATSVHEHDRRSSGDANGLDSRTRRPPDAHGSPEQPLHAAGRQSRVQRRGNGYGALSAALLRAEAAAPERLASLFWERGVAYLHRVLPKSMAGSLPPIGDRWGGFRDRDGLLIARDSFDVDRVIERLKLTPTRTRFAAFVSKLGATSTDPSFHFHHLPLPHSAWRPFRPGANTGIRQRSTASSTHGTRGRTIPGSFDRGTSDTCFKRASWTGSSVSS